MTETIPKRKAIKWVIFTLFTPLSVSLFAANIPVGFWYCCMAEAGTPFQGPLPASVVEHVADDTIKTEKLIGRVIAVSKDAKSFTFEGGAADRPAESVKFEVKIGEKTAIIYFAVATGGAKPTVGYAVALWMDDTVKGLAARVSFGGSEGGGADVNGLVVDLDEDGKGITLRSPLGGVVDGGAKPKNVNVRFNEKTVFVFSDVAEGEARIEKNQSAYVWYDDDASVSGNRIAGQVRFLGSASVSSSLPHDIEGKLLSIDKRTLTIHQLTGAREEKPKKVILKIGKKSSIVYHNVGPGGAKPTAGQGVSVWLKDGSKDTATDIALSGDAPERWVTINGTVVGISDDRATITLEQPSAVRGENPKRIEIKLTSRTRFAYSNVGPDGARLTVGYMAWVRLIDGSKDTAAQATFEGRANP